jgi:50S ribosomal protein L16 3-hydroxylase
MAVCLHAIHDMAQFAMLVDHERGTFDRHLLLPVHFLLIHHAVAFADPRIGIGKQQYRQAVLVAERCMAQAVIAAYPDHDRVELAELILERAEFIGFKGASGGVVLGVEIQYDILPALHRGKVDCLHIAIRQLEVRRFHSGNKLYYLHILFPPCGILNTFQPSNIKNFRHARIDHGAAIIGAMKSKLALLGGLTANEFLRDHWQKKPLLIRQAIPGFNGLLDPRQLIALACSEDAQARLVTQRRGKFELRQSPFEPEEFDQAGRGKANWTVLVQGVNHHLPEAAALLKHFSFIPHARLDDLMVSFAPRGGGVGPHFDSYDVFLLQGSGHRRWQISSQSDRSLIAGAPLRILSDFRAEQEWVLEAGDMLYLPPHYAHNGIAEDDCMTYSIGFRTPAYQELAEQFLVYLQDRIEIDGMYADPGLKAQQHPSEISAAMLDQAGRAIDRVRWDREDIANFLGCYLSEPKPHIFFTAPGRPLSPAGFRRAIAKRGVKLDLKSQMLCHRGWIFINGEAHQADPQLYRVLRRLADERELPALPDCPAGLAEPLYQWYLDGYISPI